LNLLENLRERELEKEKELRKKKLSAQREKEGRKKKKKKVLSNPDRGQVAGGRQVACSRGASWRATCDTSRDPPNNIYIKIKILLF
jgi:hypothetical protein